ncbi:MAG: HlyD family efflux transporter periplasmic adaptor subunit [Ruthenibacterium sp.]
MAQTPSGKKKRTGTKLLIGLLLVVPAVYVIVQVATIAARSSALLTQTAVQGTMAESVVCEGFLGMTEQIITYEGSGVLSYIAKNGERVSEGIGVAQLFASEADAAEYKRYTALSQEIELLTKAQATGSAGDASLLERQVQTGVYDALDALDSGDFSSLETAKNDIQLAQDKLKSAWGKIIPPALQNSQPAEMH